MSKPVVYIVIGPTASGKTARAIELAKEFNGEVISMDSRQVFRTLSLGTEKITHAEMQGVPHHLIDIRDPEESYSAGNFVKDVTALVPQIIVRGHTPIIAGGTHFYLDALMHGIPEDTPINTKRRSELRAMSLEALQKLLHGLDANRYAAIDIQNPRRLTRAIEIAEQYGSVPERAASSFMSDYSVHIEKLVPEREVLRERIRARLKQTLEKGLVSEVRSIKKYFTEKFGEDFARQKLKELGLEYAVVNDFLENRLQESELERTLEAKLWQYAKRQLQWVERFI